ncbi:MMPL family transporter, partial [Aquisalimonas sp. APHAB1-3]|uniref:MMPL family transporter n=1 Tax=Aquisalimonas sp. APHAB1-3 TaxID=3402080 RepID=UPI003AAF6C3B
GLLLGAAAGGYGTGVDVEFSEEVFFPDEDRIEAYQQLPEPFAPGQYNFMRVLSYLEDDFGIPFVQSVTVYADDRDVRSDHALTDIDRAIANPPDAFESTDRRAEASSVLDSIEAEAERNPEFARTVDRYDTTGDGVPDRDVDRVYDELFDSASADDARNYVTTDRSSTRIEFQPDVDAEDDEVVAAAHAVADGMALDATPTGTYVVNQAVADRISESAVNSLFVAFVLTAIFLVLTYWWLEGRAVYGVINLVPVLITVALLAGSMRYFDIALSPFNAPILGVSIGLGIDYTVHFMHRFVDEFDARGDVHDALRVTAQGTGGALTGSMLTTVSGLGVLALALIPLIVEYGL